MIVNTEKLNFDAGKANAKEQVRVAPANSSRAPEANTSHSDIGLSQKGQSLNSLYQLSLSVAKQTPSPVYIGTKKRVELLAESVNEIAKQSEYKYTPDEIKRVIDDITVDMNIVDIPPGDVNANSGSVYAFLNSDDKKKLADAYQFALDNNTSLDDVRTAAFSLGRARYIEAKINSGTTWAVHEPKENSKKMETDDAAASDVKNLSPRTDSDYVKSLLEQLHKGQLFLSNPYLRTSLFQDVSSSMLLNQLPAFLKQNA